MLAESGYSSAMKSKIIESLQKIVKTIRSVMTAEKVIAGYERTGQFPVDFAKAMHQSTYTYNVKEWDTITGAVDRATAIFRLRGELTEAEMDALEIPSVKDTQADKRPMDERMLHQQRAVIMNSADCIAKYKNHYAKKRLAARERRENRTRKSKGN